MLSTLLSEGFEGSFPAANGWQVGDSNSAGVAAYWDDVYSTFGGEGTHGGFWKGYVAGVGYAGLSATPTYQNSMTAYMQRTIDLRGQASGNLSFWFKTPSIETGYDFFRVKIDNTVVFSTDQAQSAWTQINVGLGSWVGAWHTLRFEFTSDSSVTREGAYLDDILVTANPPVQQPDLQGYWCTVTDSVQWGQTVTVQQAQIRNAGLGSAVPFQVQWYLSRDSLGSSDDILLPLAGGAGTSHNHAAIAANSFGPMFSVTVQLPSTLPTGWSGTGFYVIMKTDSAGQNNETNENNNFGQVGNTYDRDPITITAPVNGDDNDQIRESVRLQGMTQDRVWPNGVIDSPTDVDMFSFTVTAGQRVAFDLDQLSSPGIDSYLRLFDSTGNQLDFDDDGDERDAPGEPSSLESYFEYTFRTAGTYYLGVSGYGNSSYNPITGDGDRNGSTGAYRLTLTPMVDIRALTPILDYTTLIMHLGNDYNTDSTRPQQDVGRVVVAPVSGRVVFFDQYRSGAGYGDLLVAIEVPVPMSTVRRREDGLDRPLTSGFMTVFIGHMTTRRYNSAGVLNTEAPQINLTVGDQVVAGQTHLGYVAPDGRRGAGTAPHVHVGVLPYSENGTSVPAPFSIPASSGGGDTHFPGRWDTSDARPHLVDVQQSTYYNWVRSVLIAPPTDWDGWVRF